MSTQYRLAAKNPHILSLIVLSAFAAMGAILMTPALPAIADYFHISVAITQLNVTSFLLGYALGQLIYGPVANQWGRKPALYIGIGLATLGSLFSILASPVDSFPLLITGRLLEALGSSAGLVVCFIIINDFYYPPEARRVTGMMMIAFAIVPGVAIAIGGMLTEYIYWQACFYFLFLYGLLLLIPAFRMSETVGNKDPHALHIKMVLHNYLKIFQTKKLVGYGLIAGCSAACIYVFGAEGPFIGHVLGIEPATYGFLGLIPFIGVLLGCLVNLRFTHLDPNRVLKFAFCLELLASILMMIFFAAHWISLWTLLLPMTVLGFGHPMITATSTSLAMTHTEDRANGAAVMSFLLMGVPVFMTLVLSASHATVVWIMPAIFLGTLLLMLFIYLGLVRA